MEKCQGKNAKQKTAQILITALKVLAPDTSVHLIVPAEQAENVT